MKKTFIIALSTFLLFSNIVLAIPGVPHQFYGTVTWNGASAPDGTSVVAKINGVEVASTTTSGGKYGYSPLFYVSDPNNVRSGSIINFFVNGVDTSQTYYFCNGCSTNLNLVATGGTGQQGGGGGGGGGTSGGTTGGTTNGTGQTGGTQQCQERWTCTDWSACENGEQTRTCTEINNCGTDLYRPFESQPCTKQQTEEVSKSQTGGLGPTAFFLALSTTEWAATLVVAIVIVLIIIFFLRRRSRKQVKKTV
jgi:hypothetical protein